MKQDNSSAEIAPAAQDWDLRLLLICHAEAMDIRQATDASIDTGLTARGWQQTDALGAWLTARFAIDALVSAPELRNRLTAQRIGQAIGLPVTIHRANADKPFGASVGSDEATLAIPRTIQRAPLNSATAGDSTTDSEARRSEFCTDIRAVLDAAGKTHPGDTIAAVMGAELIAQVIGCLTGASRFNAQSAPTSLAELRLQASSWTIASINRHEHLPTPPGKGRTPASIPHTPAVPEALDANLAKIVEVYNRAATSDAAVETREARRIQDCLDFAKLDAGLSILDVGAGRGALSVALAERDAKEVIGIDISPAMLEQAELHRLTLNPNIARRVYFRLAAAHALPFRDERFDVVICRLLLHHIRKPDDLLRELVRVLRVDGQFVLADLLSNDDPVKRATQNAIEERRNPTHHTARSAQQYRELLTKAGLTVVDEKPVTFERELNEWLGELPLDSANSAVVRDMMEAGIETDAAGLNVRRHGDTITFEQRLFYCKAVKR